MSTTDTMDNLFTEEVLAGCTPAQFKALMDSLNNNSVAATVICRTFNEQQDQLKLGMNTMYLIFAGALVFIMHGGFAMLCAGAIRSKNAMNILLQTILDAAASALMFYVIGFGFAYGVGDSPNQFIGDALFGMSRWVTHNTGVGEGRWTDWFFQWAFAATAATIPAGAVAERFNFNAYLGYSIFMSGFLYPVVVHWVWCVEGWLGYGTKDPFIGAGMIDFAGSGVVHLLGGLAGLAGCALVGPRLGRFDIDGKPVPMPGHSAILVVLGTVLLWFGWYGFNPGSALIIDNPNSAAIAGRSAVLTTLSGASGAFSSLCLGFLLDKAWNLIATCNGVLVGFVSITAGCHVMEPWAAILAGGIGAMVFEGSSRLLLKLQIDDPLCAVSMHGTCGAWGVFVVGLLAKQEYVRQAYARDTYPHGLFYGGGGRLLASQVVGIIVIAAWTCGLMVPFFYVFKRLRCLRIPPDQEEIGLDRSKHGGSAYNYPLADVTLDAAQLDRTITRVIQDQSYHYAGLIGRAVTKHPINGAVDGLFSSPLFSEDAQLDGFANSPSSHGPQRRSHARAVEMASNGSGHRAPSHHPSSKVDPRTQIPEHASEELDSPMLIATSQHPAFSKMHEDSSHDQPMAAADERAEIGRGRAALNHLASQLAGISGNQSINHSGKLAVNQPSKPSPSHLPHHPGKVNLALMFDPDIRLEPALPPRASMSEESGRNRSPINHEPSANDQPTAVSEGKAAANDSLIAAEVSRFAAAVMGTDQPPTDAADRNNPGMNDTAGMSDTAGINDTAGMSNTAGISDTAGMSNTAGISDAAAAEHTGTSGAHSLRATDATTPNKAEDAAMGNNHEEAVSRTDDTEGAQGNDASPGTLDTSGSPSAGQGDHVENSGDIVNVGAPSSDAPVMEAVVNAAAPAAEGTAAISTEEGMPGGEQANDNDAVVAAAGQMP